MIVIDASALVEILIGGEFSQDLTNVAEASELHAPELIDAETANGLRGNEARGIISAGEAESMLHDLRSLPIARHESSPFLPFAWRWRENLTIYDSLYLELAVQSEAPLLTIDKGLIDVATGQAGVEIVGPLAR